MNSTPANPGSNPMFNFEGHDLRVVIRNDQPWFVALDVCRALDIYIRIRDGKTELHNNFKRRLDEDEVAPTNCGGKSMCSISESGLYKLIMRAQPRVNPRVHRFQNWVTREVLPALRKDGMYVMDEEKVKTGARVKSSGPGLLRPATSSRPLALQHQGEDGGCILGCPTCETRSTIAACCGVWHTLGQNLEEDQAP